MKTVRYSAAGGVVIHGDAVLLLNRPTRNEVRLPKGHIEDGESPEVAALRETAEESGYVDLMIKEDLGSRVVEFEYDDKRVERTEHYFLMDLASATTAVRPPKDAAQFQVFWVPLQQAAAMLTFEAERDVVERAIRSRA
jgi:8-oxo-dGTP pyrophosphatase MutT (NUDIX family)